MSQTRVSSNTLRSICWSGKPLGPRSRTLTPADDESPGDE